MEDSMSRSIARFLYLKPTIPKNLRPVSRTQNLHGYSFEAQVAAAELVGAEPASFSFQVVCELVGVGLGYQLSVLRAWREDARSFAQTLTDASDNMEQQYWPEKIKPQMPQEWLVPAQAIYGPKVGLFGGGHAEDERKRLVLSMWASLRFWLVINDSIQRLKRLGMPETGSDAIFAVTQPGSLREEYRTLCRAMNELTDHYCGLLSLAWAQGRGGKYVEFITDDNEFGTWYNIQFEELAPTHHLEEEFRLDGFLRDFINATYENDTCQYSIVPARQTLLFLELGIKVDPNGNSFMTRHVNRQFSNTIGIYNVSCAIKRAYTASNAGPVTSDYLSESPRSTWPTTYGERMDKFFAMVDYCHEVDTIGGYDIFHAAYDKTDLDACAATYLNLSRALDAKFGPLEEYFIPADILQRQPYWKPERKSQSSAPILPATLGHPVSLHPISTAPIGQSGYAYCKENGINITPESTEEVIQAVEQLSLAVAEDVIVPTVFLVNSHLYNIASQLLGEGIQSTAGQLRWEQIMNLMKHIGFKVEGAGGSRFRFSPPRNAGRFFVEHAPHPEPTIDWIRYRALGKRLQRLYGWTVDWFTVSQRQK